MKKIMAMDSFNSFTKTLLEKRSEKINLLGIEKSFDWKLKQE